jgi:1-deoxy-D-xylulose-5-phosphate synthase
VADARFAKPLDEDLVRRLAREHQMLITIEEGAIGGFASQVMHALVRQGLLDVGVTFRPLLLPDAFIDHGMPEEQRRWARLTAADVVALACGTLAPAFSRRRVSVAPIPLS